MDNKYKVLVAFGAFKVGDVISPADAGEFIGDEGNLNHMIQNGTLELVAEGENTAAPAPEADVPATPEDTATPADEEKAENEANPEASA